MTARFDHADRCVGSLLGCTCGDILGAAVEGWPAETIAQRFGSVVDFVPSGRGLGCYTDDTEMTLALAESLVACGRLDGRHAAAQFALRFHDWRGYSGATLHILESLRRGADYRATGRIYFPDGSYGNGACMRIAPLGLAYRHAQPDVLRAAVTDAVMATHVHPEAIDAATVQARAVAILATTEVPETLDPLRLIDSLVRLSQCDAVRTRLETLEQAAEAGATDAEVIERVGNGLQASEALAAALWAFVCEARRPEACVIRAVSFGGDTDTIAAMAGALAGSLHGRAWIPTRWFDEIENGELGRDRIIQIARQLAAIDLRK